MQLRPVEPRHVMKRRGFDWELENLEACVHRADNDRYGFKLRWMGSRGKVIRIFRVSERRQQREIMRRVREGLSGTEEEQ